ncbi:2Fe-2S iron-sulfur cluster-binding protein [Undibacterium flavidum]|uniref:2Fe-2S iron-sulfur cluster-binding protein n=1 Tax=Undibacterium flavidum TaxID=2762297 RepID=UPI002E342794|nr:2Fe-2S iron-sulfur cluster-binding protein [Undibacterium flavidum]
MTTDIQQFKISLPQIAEEFLCAEDETILAAALRNGLIFANSCRNGSCRTCLCQMQSGQIAYTIEWPGVSFDEKLDGFILPCVAKPRSDLVLVNLVLSKFK